MKNRTSWKNCINMLCQKKLFWYHTKIIKWYKVKEQKTLATDTMVIANEKCQKWYSHNNKRNTTRTVTNSNPDSQTKLKTGEKFCFVIHCWNLLGCKRAEMAESIMHICNKWHTFLWILILKKKPSQVWLQVINIRRVKVHK